MILDGSSSLALGVAAITAGAISATLGVAGGIFLMSVILLFFSHKIAIPLHGLAQAVSNVGRVITNWRNIDWRTTLPFSVAILPGAICGYLVLDVVRSEILQFLLRFFVVFLTLFPRIVLPKGGTFKPRSFLLISFLTNLIGMLVGPSGPLIAPFFIHQGFTKSVVIATKAFCQMLVQRIKSPLFAFDGSFSFLDFKKEIFILVLGVTLGTFIGNKIVDRLTVKTYHRVVKFALVILGARISILALLKILGL
jgi:uncharacterized membrane protein YfcA